MTFCASSARYGSPGPRVDRDNGIPGSGPGNGQFFSFRSFSTPHLRADAAVGMFAPSHSFAGDLDIGTESDGGRTGNRPQQPKGESGRGPGEAMIGERGQFQSGCNAPRRPTKAGRHPRRPRVRGAPSGRTRISPSALQQDGRDGLDGLMLSRKRLAGSPHRHSRPGIKAPNQEEKAAPMPARVRAVSFCA